MSNRKKIKRLTRDEVLSIKTDREAKPPVSIPETCSRLGISRSTYRYWIGRMRDDGMEVPDILETRGAKAIQLS
jgi:hypothetical protein